MNEGLSLLHTTAHHSTRLIISLGVWAASRIHERDMNEYGYGRGVSGKEKSAASTAMNMSTMGIRLWDHGCDVTTCTILCSGREGWHGLYDRWIIMPGCDTILACCLSS